MDKIKQIITQTQDEYREVYAKGTRIDKRGFVFVGTTNRRDQLGDQTGSRRFLNMWVTKIERMSFSDKMQILAEVREKEHQIRNSAWYEFKVDIAEAPVTLREENRHITSVHELVNSQFQRADADVEYIRSLIESGDIGSTKEGLYLSAVYIAARQGHNDTRTKNAIGRVLSQLATSNTFPYKLEYKRLRINQLNMTKQQELSYTDGISNNQGQLSGYLITNR
jgi:predicted P-loop ATPase